MPTLEEIERLLDQARQIKSLASSFIDTLKPYAKEDEDEFDEASEDEGSPEDEDRPRINSGPKNLAIILALKKKMRR